MRRPLSALFGVIALALPAWAVAEEPAKGAPPAAENKLPQVPGDDIFGFTTQTDTGNVGEKNLSFESSSAFGKRIGSYATGTLKTQLSTTVAENWWFGFAQFTTYTRASGVPGINDVDHTRFDGLSGEMIWRFFPRDASGFAAALDIEPRWSRVDGASGQPVDAYSTEFKLYVDAVIIPDKLFWAFNMNYLPAIQRGLGGNDMGWAKSTSSNISTAFSYQVNENLFIGAEARYLGAYDGLFFNHRMGNALFVGPVVLVKPNEKSFLNLSWTPQLVGWGRNDPSGLDLNNFTRSQLRVKYSVTF